MITKWITRIFTGAIVYSVWAVGEASTIIPADELYSCNDDIVVAVELDASESGKFGMIQWIRPDGRTQEAYTFMVPDTANLVQTMNAWISLSPSAGASLLHGFDSSLGYAEFIGYWTVVLKIDGKKVANNKFTVDC